MKDTIEAVTLTDGPVLSEDDWAELSGQERADRFVALLTRRFPAHAFLEYDNPALKAAGGDLTIYTDSRRCLFRGVRYELTRTELALLVLLMRNAGRVVPYQTILVTVWPKGYVDIDVIRQRKCQLLIKLGVSSEELIHTVRSVGLRINALHVAGNSTGGQTPPVEKGPTNPSGTHAH